METNRERGIFNALKKQFPNAIPSYGFLRVESILKNSKGVYDFDIKNTSGSLITELKLDRNDLFVVTRLAFFLAAIDSTKPGKSVKQTYPNQTVFAAAAGFDPTDLESVYNGFFTLKIGPNVNIEAMSMEEFHYVPQTQQSSATTKSQIEFNKATRALSGLIYLHGTMDVKPQVTIPVFDGIQMQAVAANTDNKLIFHPFGFLLKGAASQK